MTEPAAMAEPGHDGPSVDDPTPAPPAERKPTSRLDRLRQKRREVRTERESLKLAIPGYGEELVAAYRVLSFEEMRKLRRKGEEMAAANNPTAELLITCDTIAAACVGFYVQEEDGTLTPLNETEDQLGDEPIRYDTRLAQVLEIDVSNTGSKTRATILGMFPTDLSIIAHLARISNWMESERAGDDEVFSTPS